MNNNNQNAQGLWWLQIFNAHWGIYYCCQDGRSKHVQSVYHLGRLLSQDDEKTTLFQIHDFLFRNAFKNSFQCEHVDQALYRTHLTTNLTK